MPKKLGSIFKTQRQCGLEFLCTLITIFFMSADLFSEIALIAEVEPSCLHNKHHNVYHDGHKFVVGS